MQMLNGLFYMPLFPCKPHVLPTARLSLKSMYKLGRMLCQTKPNHRDAVITSPVVLRPTTPLKPVDPLVPARRLSLRAPIFSRVAAVLVGPPALRRRIPPQRVPLGHRRERVRIRVQVRRVLMQRLRLAFHPEITGAVTTRKIPNAGAAARLSPASSGHSSPSS